MTVYWMTDHSNGLVDWNAQGRGGVFNSGNATSVVEQGAGYGRTNDFRLRNDCVSDPLNPGDNGCRVFRTHLEAQNAPPYPPEGLRQAWFSAWYMFGATLEGTIRIPNWWNVWEWKSYFDTGSGDNAATWVIAVANRAAPFDRLFYFYMRDRVNEVNYAPLFTLNIGEMTWYHIEAFFKASPASEQQGQVLVYLNNLLYLRADNVQTTFTGSQYGDYNYGWAVTNYPDDTDPYETNIYVSNAAITSARIGDTWPPMLQDDVDYGPNWPGNGVP